MSHTEPTITTPNIHQAAGLCLIGTGLLPFVGFVIHPASFTLEAQSIWLIAHGLIFVGLILNTVGLSWVMMAEHNSLGRLGWVGFLFCVVGLAHYIGKIYWSGLHYPMILVASSETVARIGMGPGMVPEDRAVKAAYNGGALVFSLGGLLLGSAFLRANRFKKAPVLLFMCGAFLVGVWPLLPGLLHMLSPLISAIYAVGVVWLGVILLSDQSAGQPRTSPADPIK